MAGYISEQTEPESAWIIPLSDIGSASMPEFMDNNSSNNELDDASSADINFQFPIGWMLKSNQKLGRKGKGKRMKKKDKMTAKDMYNELQTFVESGELEAEDVPKITTIQNWISTYARTFKEQATENMVKNAL
ncbi:hypothetical protein C1645_734867 [Glomus cerebriforme]|uniref:Uncharacterized protein n=1 Tax=Glomus cerebriforme TaxID=658196 RepID=A0A397TH69_9GLOM|nr:hypothetical protein C1645_734867 [Glomus cerebriforme]